MLDSVPDILYHGHIWLQDKKNREELAAFLFAHDIDIHNARTATFTYKWFEVIMYLRDGDGKHILEGPPGRESPKTEVVKKDYQLPRPKILKEGRMRGKGKSGVPQSVEIEVDP